MTSKLDAHFIEEYRERNTELETINAELLEALERALRHLEEKIEIGQFYETEIIRQDLREAIRKAKEK